MHTNSFLAAGRHEELSSLLPQLLNHAKAPVRNAACELMQVVLMRDHPRVAEAVLNKLDEKTTKVPRI